MAWLFCICMGYNYGQREKSMVISQRDENVISIDITFESQLDEELQGARELASQNVDCDVVIQFPPVSNLSILAIVALMKLHKSLTLSGRRLILFSVNSETKKLFKFVLKEFKKYKPDISSKYNLKNGILRFPFQTPDLLSFRFPFHQTINLN